MTEFNKLIVDPDFENILKDLSDKKIFFPFDGDKIEPMSPFNGSAEYKLEIIEEMKRYALDPVKGQNNIEKYKFSAYDETIIKYFTLEGVAFFIAHSLVVMGEDKYVPLVYAVFNFYTKSGAITEKSKYIKLTDNPELSFTEDCMRDKQNFLLNNVGDGSILFIDGAIIGGNLYTYMIDGNIHFLDKNIAPIYFVKNSYSDIVTQNIKELKGKYHSDMHWCNTFINKSQRTPFFKYTDQHANKNTKVFCYIKPFSSIPQRVEMHTGTYEKYKGHIDELMDIIYYLMMVQGDRNNPQIRPIAIAEKYAREIGKTISIKKYLRKLNITPTMNETRGMGG